MKKTDLDFRSLVNTLVNIHNQTKLSAAKAINISLTVRNWMIGYYIREYEMGGTDRAEYGRKLLQTLSKELVSHNLKRMSERELRRYRLFYDTYPQIREALTPEFKLLLLSENRLGNWVANYRVIAQRTRKTDWLAGVQVVL